MLEIKNLHATVAGKPQRKGQAQPFDLSQRRRNTGFYRLIGLFDEVP